MLKIREAREESGQTIEALAKASGVSARTIIRIEQNADYEPGVLASHRIAKALGVRLDDLLHDTEGTESAEAPSRKNQGDGTAAGKRSPVASHKGV